MKDKLYDVRRLGNEEVKAAKAIKLANSRNFLNLLDYHPVLSQKSNKLLNKPISFSS